MMKRMSVEGLEYNRKVDEIGKSTTKKQTENLKEMSSEKRRWRS